MANVVSPIDTGAPDHEVVAPSLGRLLRRAYKAWSKMLRQRLEPLGLTPVQFVALRELYQCDGLSLGKIARRLKADPPTMSGVVDGLSQAGLVRRVEDPEDRRRLRLCLTESARALQPELERTAEECERALVGTLAASEVRMLRSLLGRLCETAEQTCAEGLETGLER